MSDHRVQNSKSYEEYQKSFKSSNEPLSQIDYLELKVRQIQKDLGFSILILAVVSAAIYVLIVAPKTNE